jgi:hypothetical protein
VGTVPLMQRTPGIDINDDMEVERCPSNWDT